MIIVGRVLASASPSVAGVRRSAPSSRVLSLSLYRLRSSRFFQLPQGYCRLSRLSQEVIVVSDDGDSGSDLQVGFLDPLARNDRGERNPPAVLCLRESGDWIRESPPRVGDEFDKGYACVGGYRVGVDDFV